MLLEPLLHDSGLVISAAVLLKLSISRWENKRHRRDPYHWYGVSYALEIYTNAKMTVREKFTYRAVSELLILSIHGIVICPQSDSLRSAALTITSKRTCKAVWGKMTNSLSLPVFRVVLTIPLNPVNTCLSVFLSARLCSSISFGAKGCIRLDNVSFKRMRQEEDIFAIR
ncbi:hypothetical protein TNCV_3191321 [Trichonephila clavipes]|nr:hypothetical protein TNCV_3191321 [Trichonephila clavipes]